MPDFEMKETALSAQLRLKLDRQPTYRREDFILSQVNAAAVDALERWQAWHGGVLALIGPAGSGKTHLARSWADRTGAVAFDPSVQGAVLDAAAASSPVVLEDADRLEDSETLFHLINIAGRTRGGLLLTARTLPANWVTELPDLKSRLNALPVAELAAPDDVVLTGVLRNLFRDRNIRASDELLAYLVRRIDRSIPEAQRMVARLDDAADHQGRPVSRSLARQILEIEPVDGDLFDEL